MKKVIILMMLILSTKFGISQILTYEQARNVEITSKYINGDTLAKYIMKDGSEIIIGSNLRFGNPWNNNKDFTTILIGKFSLAKALLAPPIYLNENFIGENVVVTTIKVTHTKMSKNSPVLVWAYVSTVDEVKTKGGIPTELSLI